MTIHRSGSGPSVAALAVRLLLVMLPVAIVGGCADGEPRPIDPKERTAPPPPDVGFWEEPRRGANLFNRRETPERLASAAALQLDFVRLAPDKWQGTDRDFLLGNADAYEGIPPADLAELRRVLDDAHAAGLRVVLTMLSLPGARWRQNNGGEDDGRLWRNPAYREQAMRFWGDLASELAGHPALVGYDLLNEPHPGATLADLDEPAAPAYADWWASVGGSPADLNAFFADVIAAIRAADAATPIILEPSAYAAPAAFPYLEPAADSLVLYSFHFYEPWLYTTRRVNRGRYAYPERLPVGWHEGVEAWPRDRISERFATVHAWASRHGVSPSRILLGEFGVARLTEGADLWLADVIDAADARGWHWAFYSWREDGWSDMDYELGPDSLPPEVLESIWSGVRSREAWRDNRLFDVLETRIGPEVRDGGATAVSFPTEDDGTVSATLRDSGDHAVILAHGGQFTKDSWKPQARVLADSGFTTLAIDFRGRGASRGGPGRETDLESAHLDVLAAVRFLEARGAGRISIVGASFGGWAAARASTKLPPGSIDRLILLAHSPIDEPERMQGRKLFVTTRDDVRGEGVPRLPSIRDQYERAPEPKELVVLDGSAHAQHVFATEQGEQLLAEILRFLAEED